MKIKEVTLVGMENNETIGSRTIVKAGNKYYLADEIVCNTATTNIKLWQVIRESSAKEFKSIYKNTIEGLDEYIIINQ